MYALCFKKAVLYFPNAGIAWLNVFDALRGKVHGSLPCEQHNGLQSCRAIGNIADGNTFFTNNQAINLFRISAPGNIK